MDQKYEFEAPQFVDFNNMGLADDDKEADRFFESVDTVSTMVGCFTPAPGKVYVNTVSNSIPDNSSGVNGPKLASWGAEKVEESAMKGVKPVKAKLPSMKVSSPHSGRLQDSDAGLPSWARRLKNKRLGANQGRGVSQVKKSLSTPSATRKLRSPNVALMARLDSRSSWYAGQTIDNRQTRGQKKSQTSTPPIKMRRVESHSEQDMGREVKNVSTTNQESNVFCTEESNLRRMLEATVGIPDKKVVRCVQPQSPAFALIERPGVKKKTTPQNQDIVRKCGQQSSFVLKPTKSEPFRFVTQERFGDKSVKLEKMVAQEIEVQRKATVFKAGDLKVLKHVPFLPKLSEKAPTAPVGPKFQTCKRAEEREQFEAMRRRRQSDREQERKLLAEEKARREEDEVSKLRKASVHKAQPIRSFKSVAAGKSTGNQQTQSKLPAVSRESRFCSTGGQ